GRGGLPRSDRAPLPHLPRRLGGPHPAHPRGGPAAGRARRRLRPRGRPVARPTAPGAAAACGCQAEEPALDSGRALEFERAEPGSLIGALHDGDATIQVEACRFEGEDRETQLHARLVDGTGADLYVLGSDEHTPEWFADEAG